ncbi:hypothetical protein M758_9G161200 [Ceratodon purpureus]|nr:hypothetical protein M758_9G161200 [Ceratodon purpureus]
MLRSIELTQIWANLPNLTKAVELIRLSKCVALEKSKSMIRRRYSHMARLRYFLMLQGGHSAPQTPPKTGSLTQLLNQQPSPSGKNHMSEAKISHLSQSDDLSSITMMPALVCGGSNFCATRVSKLRRSGGVI